ncbi:thiamine phosphate synthase [Helicobacter suis]|uniref:Thiamine-phosphate synthase n=2 Tax=Helicobacter suis TaxID=104628 RepID=E7G569_9HELI|nr:thiamine phosphate synthase [Helicobacter suis]EFX41475.1 thiamine phosphate pyrophosphorylase [Helicobacter suis HS5]EFX43654.1 thiamine phosphate pyrophosphorylase [Helicobacter suis HS1]BCD46515.1 thiamine-phosphate synthase [Helicobacter suis]BCD47577.1 thiamine-phosphate synthase [Helicobacter suis]BCD49331.1 thiamine-phosphate synthase [Helicobacter suis]
MGIELKGLYAISDEKLTPYHDLPKLLEQAILGGVKLFQLRDKSHSDQNLRGLVNELSFLCTEKNVGFILNDRLELALECGVWGLHLGAKDTPLQEARSLFRGVIGVSCYGDLQRALKVQQMGADYVAFGACFVSQTKPNAPCIDLKILQEARACLKIPICAIGGITPFNVDQLGSVDLVAVVASLWVGDVLKNAQSLSLNSRNSKSF